MYVSASSSPLPGLLAVKLVQPSSVLAAVMRMRCMQMVAPACERASGASNRRTDVPSFCASFDSLRLPSQSILSSPSLG
ncbi:hypothetical protein BKA81DRAFT_163541 [Phyllosticta paracitricarpa]